VGAATLHPRLLIVHPNPYSADVIATVLAPLRLDCHHAAGNWAAARWLADHPGPVLVAVDPTAPDPLGLVAFARRHLPGYPVVAAFTAAAEGCEAEALRLGASAVLSYPCPADELRAAVAGALLIERAAGPGRPPEGGLVTRAPGPVPPEDTVIVPLREDVEAFERQQITRALRAFAWRRRETAEALGIERTTLYHKMKRYGLLEGEGPDPDGDALS
jgi:DNA-binding NtrC family response regulator